jgi:hypothetical protein
MSLLLAQSGHPKDLQFLLTSIVAVVPFLIIIYFGLAVINYDAIAGLSVGLAVRQPIVATDRRCISFLYRPNDVAMVGLA